MPYDSAMSSLCYVCERDIEEEEDYSECDGCNSLFHLRCAKVTKTEANAHRKSKCLKMYCPTCFNAKSEGTPEKLKEILALLYKMDCCLQQQKALNLPESIEQKLTALNQKITAQNMTSSSNNSRHTAKATHANHANTTKNASVKPAVVIKPKSKQSSTKTLEEISQKINKCDLNVCGTRSARDGAIVLRCQNSAETLKAKQIVGEKLGNDYEITLPKLKSPRVRINNIAPEIPKEQIVDELKKHNEQIANFELKLITVIPRKVRSTETNEAVLEVNSDTFNRLIEISILNLPWRECRVTEHLHVKRCYKCCGFFHKSTECKENQKCSRCAGPHKFSDCKSKSICCVNCKISNEKFKLNLDTKHHAWSKHCPVFLRRLTSVKNKIEYNESE